MQVRGLGVTAPYVGLLLSRLAFIAMLPFLRETLPAKRVDLFETSGPDEVPDKPSSFFASFFAAPLALLRPLSVLVPDKVNGRRDYRLPLIAASYGLFMIVPGLGPVKILFARGQFGWGPLETGRFITFTGILKLVVLVGVVPLAARLLRKADTPTNEPEETMEDIEVPVSSSRQPTGSRSSGEPEAQCVRGARADKSAFSMGPRSRQDEYQPGVDRIPRHATSGSQPPHAFPSRVGLHSVCGRSAAGDTLTRARVLAGRGLWQSPGESVRDRDRFGNRNRAFALRSGLRRRPALVAAICLPSRCHVGC